MSPLSINRKFCINVELVVRQDALEQSTAYVPVRCQGLQWAQLTAGYAADVDTNSIVIVRRDSERGDLIPFDLDAEGEDPSGFPGCFTIPHRFECRHDPYALGFQTEMGDLVWLAPSVPGKQFYSIYFNAVGSKPFMPASYKGLLGDGDFLRSKRTRLAVYGGSRPVYYGRQLFGRPGIVVASNYTSGIRFFEETASDAELPKLVDRGRLLDNHGNVIFGIPTFHDLSGDGRLDMIVGHNDGSLHTYTNIGSDEQPIFEHADPLFEIDGRPIDLINYLHDKDALAVLADGTISQRYPTMPIVTVHGGQTHIFTTPKFVDWSGTGRYDLLVSVKGGYLLHFERSGCRYKPGVFITDEYGEPIRCEPLEAFADVSTPDQDGSRDVLVGSSHGHLYHLRFVGNKDGVPILRDLGKVNLERESLTASCPLLFHRDNIDVLLVGNHYGHLRWYQRESDCGDTVHWQDKGYLQIDDAWMTRSLSVARYEDMTQDGRKDIISGDRQGQLYFYANLGTNRKPLFSPPYRLADEDGPIKINEGPDPTEPDDGYTKPCVADLTGDGRNDILTGTGLGRIYYYQNLGPDCRGVPHLKRGEVLRDTQGAEICCHHMSSVEAADWNDDGHLDLLVAGQQRIHACDDDDTHPSQIRWYRSSGRGPDNRLRFDPFTPLEAEGDQTFYYRPLPTLVVKDKSQTYLHVQGNNIFRQVETNRPEQVEHVGFMGDMLLQAQESFIPAYQTRATLAENDEAIITSCCGGGPLAVFRRSFIENGGYLDAIFHFTAVGAVDGSGSQSLDVTIDTAAIRVPSAVVPQVTKRVCIKRGMDADQIKQWFDDFMMTDGTVVPPDKRMMLALYYDDRALRLAARINDPMMDRLLLNATQRNGYVADDDHVSILIDPDQTRDHYYRWNINALGVFREFRVDRATGKAMGPWRIGPESATIETTRSENQWRLAVTIPFAKLAIEPQLTEQLLFELIRSRNIYANEIIAREQRLREIFRWSGADAGWVQLELG